MKDLKIIVSTCASQVVVEAQERFIKEHLPIWGPLDQIPVLLGNLIDIGYSEILCEEVDLTAWRRIYFFEALKHLGRKTCVIQPEVYLHPKSQARLVDTLIENTSEELFIFTLSEHIFNAVRLAVAYKEVNHENVIIEFMDNEAEMKYPKIYKCGGVDLWSKEFFDQQEWDLEELLSVRADEGPRQSRGNER